MAERDDAYWEGISRAVERGEYTIAGPIELGSAAAPLRLSRITLYTPAPVLRQVAAAYGAVRTPSQSPVRTSAARTSR